jgi:acetoin utilization deacetylase AcuC-like enzyme
VTRTGFSTSPLFQRHDTGKGHPERAERTAAIERRLQTSELWKELLVIQAPEIARERLSPVHTPAYVREVEAAIESGARVLDDGDTRVSADSWRAARAAAGGAVDAVDRVMSGEWDNAFVCARPPGHHAERSSAMGFCLFNNVAIAAQHLRQTHRLERVAILDWDVHHGNGTQHIFERDPSVFYASLHQWPLYPGTGLAHERGIAEGEGTTLNCPQPAHAGDKEWLRAFEHEVLPSIERFKPEFVLISAGFDAHRDDPLAQTLLSDDAYKQMTAALLQLAQTHCRGRLVSLLEGGYDLDALSRCVAIHLEELHARPGT